MKGKEKDGIYSNSSYSLRSSSLVSNNKTNREMTKYIKARNNYGRWIG